MRAHALVLRDGQLDRLETARLAALTHVPRPRQRITHDRVDPLVTGPKDRLVRRSPRGPLVHATRLPATIGFKHDAPRILRLRLPRARLLRFSAPSPSCPPEAQPEWVGLRSTCR